MYLLRTVIYRSRREPQNFHDDKREVHLERVISTFTFTQEDNPEQTQMKKP